MTTNRICWLLSAFILLCAIGSQYAHGETYLYAGAWSKHLTSDEELNEQHNLVAIEHNNWFAGTFKNSYDRESYAVARKFSWSYAELEGGVFVGAVRGYRRCWGDDDSSNNTCPFAAPYVTWDAGPVNPTVFLLGEALAISVRIGL